MQTSPRGESPKDLFAAPRIFPTLPFKVLNVENSKTLLPAWDGSRVWRCQFTHLCSWLGPPHHCVHGIFQRSGFGSCNGRLTRARIGRTSAIHVRYMLGGRGVLMQGGCFAMTAFLTVSKWDPSRGYYHMPTLPLASFLFTPLSP